MTPERRRHTEEKHDVDKAEKREKEGGLTFLPKLIFTR